MRHKGHPANAAAGYKLAAWNYGPWDGRCVRCGCDGPFDPKRRTCRMCVGKVKREWQQANSADENLRKKIAWRIKRRDPALREQERQRAAANRAKARAR